MSFHTITMMVRWAVTADDNTAKVLEELRDMDMNSRMTDPRSIWFVKKMRNDWARGSKIERLATFGWQEYESLQLFCQMLDRLESLRKEFHDRINMVGPPPDLCDEDVELYEEKSYEERKQIK
jgi:hypothetical protein